MLNSRRYLKFKYFIFTQTRAYYNFTLSALVDAQASVMLSQDHDAFRICGEGALASGSTALARHRDAPLLPRWSRGAVLELGCPRLHCGPTTGWLRDLRAGIYFLCTSFLRLSGR